MNFNRWARCFSHNGDQEFIEDGAGGYSMGQGGVIVHQPVIAAEGADAANQVKLNKKPKKEVKKKSTEVVMEFPYSQQTCLTLAFPSPFFSFIGHR